MTSTSVKVIWADFGSIFTRLTRNLLIFNPCAQDETRTHTILRPLPPQSSVYTNFTTCAFFVRSFFYWGPQCKPSRRLFALGRA